MDDFAYHQARQFGAMEGYGPLAQLIEALRRRWSKPVAQQQAVARRFK